jgi:hypothetical protein
MTASGVRMGEAIGTAGDEQGAERQRRGINDRSEGRERKLRALVKCLCGKARVTEA